MKLKIAKTVITVIFIANVLVIAGMLVSGFSFLLDPSKFRYVAPMGMLFPFFAAANFAFLVLWLFLKPLKALFPFIALVACYVPVRKYVSFSRETMAPEGAIKVMSYNALDFKGMENHLLDRRDNQLVYFLIAENADVICLQECREGGVSKEMYALLEEQYPYHHYCSQGKSFTSLSLYSKYPVMRVDSIPCDTMAVSSVAYTIATPKGYAIVINNHFESNRFTNENKKEFRNLMHGGMKNDSAKIESRYMYSRFQAMSIRRRPQVKAVASYIKRNKDVPIILCGDFNEIPISYNHYILDKVLTDCFREAGFGFGWTYAHNGMRVRIDNIMCSEHFTPYNCKVLSDITYSDHFPIVCELDLNDGKGENKE